MALTRLMVKGLYEEDGRNVDFVFNDDLTLLTGKNGCGKTTLLKLIWYSVSPNVERIFEELSFLEAHIETTDYKLDLRRRPNRYASMTMNDGTSIVAQDKGEEGVVYTRSGPELLGGFYAYVEDINHAIEDSGGSSLFFPTFRRFEEGGLRKRRVRTMLSRVSQAISQVSEEMSVGNHRYIASVSTEDIRALVTQKYAALSENALRMRDDLFRDITRTIKETDATEGGAEETLSMLEDMVKESDKRQEREFHSYEELKQMVGRFMSGKDIQISNSISWGDVDNAISSDYLSAGEKQVLGFLAYNAFFQNTPIIIDEPELSLHVDWQRELVPALLKQGTNNQFIMATHSPFIYSRYPEKEIMIGDDRGE